MPSQPAIPQPLYIADANERLLDMLAECMAEKIIEEVEKEEAEKQSNRSPLK